jgi:hypothetical protein
VMGRFGRDMLDAGDPHQIAGLLDTFDHSILLILDRRDRIPELTAEYKLQTVTFR